MFELLIILLAISMIVLLKRSPGDLTNLLSIAIIVVLVVWLFFGASWDFSHLHIPGRS